MSSPPTMTGGNPKKSVQFNDDLSDLSFTRSQQHDCSPSAASDDTDETIRPGHPSPYTYDSPVDFSPDAGDFGSSKSTLLSDAEPLYMANASSSSVPLLSRQSPSPPSSILGIESQFARGSRSIRYGTTVASSPQRTALQETQSTSYRYPSGQIEVEQDVRLQWHSLWKWLRGTNTPTQGMNEPGSTTNEEGARSRCESDNFSTISRSKKIANGFQTLIPKIHGLCNSAEQSTTTVTIVQTGSSLSFMLILAVVVFAIGYGVYELAMMDRRDR